MTRPDFISFTIIPTVLHKSRPSLSIPWLSPLRFLTSIYFVPVHPLVCYYYYQNYLLKTNLIMPNLIKLTLVQVQLIWMSYKFLYHLTNIDKYCQLHHFHLTPLPHNLDSHDEFMFIFCCALEYSPFSIMNKTPIYPSRSRWDLKNLLS